jgi:hypothetical protein
MITRLISIQQVPGLNLTGEWLSLRLFMDFLNPIEYLGAGHDLLLSSHIQFPIHNYRVISFVAA